MLSIIIPVFAHNKKAFEALNNLVKAVQVITGGNKMKIPILGHPDSTLFCVLVASLLQIPASPPGEAGVEEKKTETVEQQTRLQNPVL